MPIAIQVIDVIYKHLTVASFKKNKDYGILLHKCYTNIILIAKDIPLFNFLPLIV